MKKSAILLIGIIAVAIGVIISTYADSSTYGSFNDAKDSAAELHVVGRLDLAKDMVYNPKKDANYFSFYVNNLPKVTVISCLLGLNIYSCVVRLSSASY